MSKVKFYKEEQIPLEMHKVRVVQKLTLLPVEERLKKIQEAGKICLLTPESMRCLTSRWLRWA